MWNSRRLPRTDGEEETKAGIGERLSDALRALRELLATRAEIFQEELAVKGSLFGRGAAGLIVALFFAGLALLLFTALVAVLLVNLLGSLWLGLLAALVLYLAVAGVAGWLGWKSLSKLRPFDFPETRRGLSEDFAAVRDAVMNPPAEGEGEADLEERFRAGSE